MTVRLVAVILAGGKGERLGGAIKANLMIGGVRLLERVSAIVMPHVSATLVSVGHYSSSELPLLPGQLAVPDLSSSYSGPIAGVAAAVHWSMRQAQRPEALVTVAVDTPLLSADFVSRLLGAFGGQTAAAVAACNGQSYSTNAMWRLAALSSLPSRLSDETAPRSLRRLAAELDARFVEWDPADGDPFANVNTHEDLALLERRVELATRPKPSGK